MEYKIGRKLGSKPKELALSAIADNLENGDVVRLTSDIIDSVTIKANITIDGQGHTFFIEDNVVGLNLHNHCKVINCNLSVGERANAINIRQKDLELILENCSFFHRTFEDAYPAISWTIPLARLYCDNVTIDNATLNTRVLEGGSLTLGHPQFTSNDIYLKIDKNYYATDVKLETLNLVNSTTNIAGTIHRLNALQVSVSTRGKILTLDEFMMDMGLDPDQIITDEVVTGLKIYGNVTIKQVVSPDEDQALVERYAQVGKLFHISPKANKSIINISGNWNVKNMWVNQIFGGQVHFTNYTDVNQWYIKSEEAGVFWKDSNFRYKKDYVAKPKPKTAQDQLDEMIGLTDVKKKVKAYIATSVVNKKRKELGQAVTESSLHLIFGGSAGTGKTQVARLLAKILFDNGIIAKNLLKEVTAKDMIGEFLGQTSPKTHNLIMEAIGGILFIDEAYELNPSEGDSDSYKKEAIATLIKDMEDYRSDLIVIMAGYTQDMEKLLQANSGLPSRFVNKINFPDYTEEELIEIAHLQLGLQKQTLDDEGKASLENFIRQAKQNGQVDGNGRWVRNLLQFISQARDVRIVSDGTMESDPAALNTITAADVQEGINNF